VPVLGPWSALAGLEVRVCVCWGLCVGLVAVADYVSGAVEEAGELRFYAPG
jgi:hypothetical protein